MIYLTVFNEIQRQIWVQISNKIENTIFLVDYKRGIKKINSFGEMFVSMVKTKHVKL